MRRIGLSIAVALMTLYSFVHQSRSGLAAVRSDRDAAAIERGTARAQAVRNRNENNGRDPLWGVEVKELDRETRQRYRIPANLDGVVVVDVHLASRAAAVGLRPGDVILEVNELRIRSIEDFNEVLASPSLRDGAFLLVRTGRRLAYFAWN